MGARAARHNRALLTKSPMPQDVRPSRYEAIGREYRWRQRPYVRAVWVTPRYRGHRYYPGYWRR